MIFIYPSQATPTPTTMDGLDDPAIGQLYAGGVEETKRGEPEEDQQDVVSTINSLTNTTSYLVTCPLPRRVITSPSPHLPFLFSRPHGLLFAIQHELKNGLQK
jgi:hypothetical protein